MAVESILSPEHHSHPSAQHRRRLSEEVKTYQNWRKRSSKDWFPPDLALVTSSLNIRKTINGKNTHTDRLETCQEVGSYIQHMDSVGDLHVSK